MTVTEFLSEQSPENRLILTEINDIIVNADKNVTAEIGLMMGIEMILYKTKGFFKYGLSITKSHFSLHLMPIYASPALHATYKNLLNKAKFQKGCINFKKAEEMPLDIVRELLDDCARVDLIALMEKYKQDRKP
ncbi:MAG: DUF1801 domain-containing protein [Bacteroidetes bacterium]|nr:DUF1801 domain-containing protein [Bacteroidota bacterium]